MPCATTKMVHVPLVEYERLVKDIENLKRIKKELEDQHRQVLLELTTQLLPPAPPLIEHREATLPPTL